MVGFIWTWGKGSSGSGQQAVVFYKFWPIRLQHHYPWSYYALLPIAR